MIAYNTKRISYVTTENKDRCNPKLVTLTQIQPFIIRIRYYFGLVKRLLLTADYTYRQSRKKIAIFPFKFNLDLLEGVPIPEHVSQI